jgi:hypothetical protein
MAVKIKCELHNYFCMNMVDNWVHVCTKAKCKFMYSFNGKRKSDFGGR